MKYTLDSVCGGPKVNRKPLVIHKTALEKLATEQIIKDDRRIHIEPRKAG